MKVAAAAMGDAVAGHFGHCKDFVIYEYVSHSDALRERKA